MGVAAVSAYRDAFEYGIASLALLVGPVLLMQLDNPQVARRKADHPAVPVHLAPDATVADADYSALWSSFAMEAGRTAEARPDPELGRRLAWPPCLSHPPFSELIVCDLLWT